MDTRELYPVLESVHYALKTIVHPGLSTDLSLTGFSDFETDTFLFLPKLDASIISPAVLSNRFPYTSSDLFLSTLKKLSRAGLLVCLPDNEFILTENGSWTIHHLEQKKNDILAGFSLLPVNDLMDLASRLKEIADSCIAVGTPPGKWCIQLARRNSPAAGSPILCRIDQFINELIAFRDDANHSVMKAYCVSGHAWDILTVLWMEHKMSMFELIRKMDSRGFSTDQTFHAVDELAKKGLVLPGVEEVQISPFGSEVRKIAEDTIDRYYFAPWKYFSTEYLEQLLRLLNLCHRNLPVLDVVPW